MTKIDSAVATLRMREKSGLGVFFCNRQHCTHWYISYSEADFDIFAPHGWRWNLAFLHAKLHLIGATTRVYNPQNWNVYWECTKIRNRNAPQRRIPCAIFTKFAEFVPRFRIR